MAANPFSLEGAETTDEVQALGKISCLLHVSSCSLVFWAERNLQDASVRLTGEEAETRICSGVDPGPHLYVGHLEPGSAVFPGRGSLSLLP